MTLILVLMPMLILVLMLTLILVLALTLMLRSAVPATLKRGEVVTTRTRTRTLLLRQRKVVHCPILTRLHLLLPILRLRQRVSASHQTRPLGQ